MAKRPTVRIGYDTAGGQYYHWTDEANAWAALLAGPIEGEAGYRFDNRPPSRLGLLVVNYSKTRKRVWDVVRRVRDPEGQGSDVLIVRNCYGDRDSAWAITLDADGDAVITETLSPEHEKIEIVAHPGERGGFPIIRRHGVEETPVVAGVALKSAWLADVYLGRVTDIELSIWMFPDFPAGALVEVDGRSPAFLPTNVAWTLYNATKAKLQVIDNAAKGNPQHDGRISRTLN